MKTLRKLLFLLAFVTAFIACKKDDEPLPLAQPTINNVEIGLNNNEIGVIGRDFHINADILAGDKIENVQIKIQQRSGETYSKVWAHEVTYDQYKGAKNATVHKHFDIPADAAEGKYDFLIIVNDHNGTRLEEKRSLTIYAVENLPVNPQVSVFNIFGDNGPIYWNGEFIEPGTKLKTGDVFNSQVNLSGVKGDGKMYLLLIHKKANHRPETIEQIDFNKAIVYDVWEHQNWTEVGDFSNFIFDEASFTPVREIPQLAIGAANDNNLPPAPINGAKAWQPGDYYYGVVYQNTTYNMSFYHYIELPIE